MLSGAFVSAAALEPVSLEFANAEYGRDKCGHHSRNGSLHVAGTGERPDGRSADGYLRVWLRPLRDADGKACVRRRRRDGDSGTRRHGGTRLGQLAAGTLPSIQRLLRRALKKDPRQRLGDIRDARIEIEEAGTEPAGSVSPASAHGARRAWIVAAVAALVARCRHSRCALSVRNSAVASPVMRVEITTPSTLGPARVCAFPRWAVHRLCGIR